MLTTSKQRLISLFCSFIVYARPRLSSIVQPCFSWRQFAVYQMYNGVVVVVGLRLVVGMVEDLLWDGLRYIDCEWRRWCDDLRL